MSSARQFEVEVQYLLPVWQTVRVEAADPAAAGEIAIRQADDDWEPGRYDFDCSGSSYVSAIAEFNDGRAQVAIEVPDAVGSPIVALARSLLSEIDALKAQHRDLPPADAAHAFIGLVKAKAEALVRSSFDPVSRECPYCADQVPPGETCACERCRDCGGALDLDGFDGRCGNCADQAEPVA